MKNIPIKLLILSVSFLLCLSLFSFWWKETTKPLQSEQKLNFIIAKGSSALQTAKSLKEKGLIRSELAFKIYVQFTGKSKKIKPGLFVLTPNMSMYQIVDELTKGPKDVWVTIPEGLRKEEVVEKIIQALEKEGEEAKIFRSEFLNLAKDKEGYLFPDTYLIPRDISPQTIISLLIENFHRKTDELKEEIQKGDYTLEEIVILSSIVERETRKDEERPIVAGILLKRLKNQIPLQVDATVQYALASRNCQALGYEKTCDNWWPILKKTDLDIDSEFNTYKYKGLPPSPISNPGIASIKASVYPEESEFWFYLHDQKGEIHLAKTIEEHVKNIEKFLR